MARNRDKNGKNGRFSDNNNTATNKGNRFSEQQKGRNDGKSRSNNTNIPEILKKDIADFNWYKPVGTTIGSRGWNGSVPIVAAIKVQPSLGITNSPSSPTHQMARIMYNEIVRVNATSCPYEPVDLQLALLAVSELYKFTVWAGRFYKYLRMYSRFNRAIPDYFFNAENAIKASFDQNTTDYRAWYNNFVLKCSTISLPGNLQFFKNIDDMFSGVFIDEDSERAQFTMFVPYVFYKYSERGAHGGQLIPIIPGYTRRSTIDDSTYGTTLQHDNKWAELGTPFTPTGVFTINDVMRIGDELLEALLRSEDICRISADVYKAYGPEKLVHFNMLNEDDMLPIYYSPDMNSMIENSILVGRPQMDTVSVTAPEGDYTYAPAITQNPNLDGGNLIFEMYGRRQMGDPGGPMLDYFNQDYIFNVHDDREVTPDVMIDLARWTPTLDFKKYAAATNAGTVHINSCGTEILLEAEILYVGTHGEIERLPIDTSTICDTNIDVSEVIKRLAYANAFHYFPRVAPVLTKSIEYCIEFKSFDKYAVVPQKDIKQIHDTYLITQFQVPDYNYSLR